ncbi:MAG TPA: NDP-sugar synthase [Actinomycetes bacterium]|nr:NDP-sugar synthase [Actinomycetes bacterium]
MEAVLLVGGLGTRLRPLTLRCPKPMLPVAGVPFVAHQLALAAEAGVTRVVLATAYRPEVFARLGDGSAWGVELVLVTEEEPLGTGGAIANAGTRLESGAEDPVVILNGDVLSGHDLRAQLRMHRDVGADVTLHLVEVEDARPFGSVPTDATGRVTAFLEKSENPPTNRINAGCYVFRRSVVAAIPSGRVVSVERETFPGLLAGGAVVQGYVETAYWLDLGTPAALVRGSCDVVRGVLHSPARPGPAGESLVLEGARVAPGARITGGSVVGPGAVVEGDAIVDGCVVASGAVVRSGVRACRSVVGVDAVVGERTRLEDAVVGDGAFVGADCELVAGARVWADVHLPDKAVRVSSDA